MNKPDPTLKRRMKSSRIKIASKTSLPSKYRNIKTTVDGYEYASKKEAKRAQELQFLAYKGLIKRLAAQIKYTLIPSQVRSDGTKERPVVYIADFVYEDEHGNEVVEDCKGMKTDVYILKRKLMLQVHGITIKEV